MHTPHFEVKNELRTRKLSRRFILAVAAIAACLWPTLALGQTNSAWNGGTGDWSNPLNWNDGVPNGNYNALITPAGSSVTLDINATIDNLTLNTGDNLGIGSGNTLTFQASGGSTINNSGTITLASSGSISIGAGSSLVLDGGQLVMSGGSISGATSAESMTNYYTGEVTGYGTISSVGFTNDGSLTVAGGTLNIKTNSQGFDNNGFIQIDAGSTLKITGGPVESNPDDNSSLVMNGASLVTLGFFNGYLNLTRIDNGSTAVVNGNLNNQGSIELSQSTMTINGNATNLNGDNFALFYASNGSTLDIKGTVTQQEGIDNEFDIAGGSAVNIGGSFINYGESDVGSGGVGIGTGSTLTVHKDFIDTAGMISASGGSVLDVGHNLVIRDYAAFGILSLSKGSIVTVGGTLFNSLGQVLIDSTSVLNADSGYQQMGGNRLYYGYGSSATPGNTVVDGVLNVGGTGVNIHGGTLSGTGVINGNVTMGGRLIPGDEPAPGTLTIHGKYTQMPGATLIDPIASLGESSMLEVTGAADLFGGVLDIDLLNGFVPTAGETFEVMSYGSLDGAFTRVNGRRIDSSLFFDVEYGPHDITLVVMDPPSPSPTPEGSTFLLFGTGLVLLISISRRFSL
jgi:hypothetical protein